MKKNALLVRVAAVAVLAALFTPTASQAGLVSYSTKATGVPVLFTHGDTVTVLVKVAGLFGINTEFINVYFDRVASGSTNTPDVQSLGTLTWDTFSPLGGQPNGTDTHNFDLTVKQTAPATTPDHTTFDGALLGTFHRRGPEEVAVSFANTTISLGGITYQLLTGKNGVDLASNQSLNISSGGTTLYARITAVPEPSTMISGGIAMLMGLGFVARHRKRAVAV